MQLAYDLAAARKNESKIKIRRQRIEETARTSDLDMIAKD